MLYAYYQHGTNTINDMKIINYIKLLFFTPNLFSVADIKECLKTQTHGGKYWNAIPKYNFLKHSVYISGPADAVVVDTKTGLGRFSDLDDDGCSEDDSCDLIIKLRNPRKENEPKLKLFKTK